MMGNRTPFVLMIFGLIVLLLGIQGGEEVITGSVTAIAAASDVSWGGFLEFILQFLPVLYYVGIMTLAGGLGVVGVLQSGNPIISLIYGLILALIGVQSIPTVIDSVDSAITAASGLPFLTFILPFVPVMFVVALIGIVVVIGSISLSGLRARRA